LGAIANIVLNDAAATPVAHTFNPARQGLVANSQVAEFEDRVVNGGIPVGFYRFSIDFSRPMKQRKSYRVKLKLETPVLETVSNSTVSGIAPAPTVSYTPLVQIDVVIPERSSLQIRKDLRKMIYEALNNTQVVNAIENLDAPY
jgi:hypothetical protein